MATERPWSALSLEIVAPAADAVINFLVERGANGVVTEDVRTAAGELRTRLEAHVPREDAADVASALATYLDALTRIDPGWIAGPVDVAPVPPTDWETVFRAHHTPLVVGERLVIAPPWDVPAAADREVLVIEPGMAFGTGHHATTRACLEALEALVAAGGVRRALDVGTGSGVLAAALARLGVPEVVAIDLDVAVLPIARGNVDRNGASRVHLFAGTLAAVRGRFDVVVANILADTLLHEAAELARVVAPDGRLVLSGLLADQVERVLTGFPGWRTIDLRADDAWRTITLARVAA